MSDKNESSISHNFNHLFSFAWLIFLFLLMGSCNRKTEQIRPAYAMAIHGGAGVIKPENMTTSMDSAYRAALSEALKKGEDILKNGGTSIDAVTTAITFMEDSPLFNAGKGAVFNEAGQIEHDASVMEGKDHGAGAVGAVRNIKNPVLAARKVMEDGRHVFLVSQGAEKFAATSGLVPVDPSYFFTQKQWDKYEKTAATQLEREFELNSKHGTVGAVALDQEGNLAAGTSTGGMHFKRVDRLGDSPVIGAGTYADNESCAVSATGHGEYFIKNAVAYDISARMRYAGQSLEEASDFVIMDKLQKLDAGGGIIAIDHFGNISLKFNTPGMFRASVKAGEPMQVRIYTDELEKKE